MIVRGNNGYNSDSFLSNQKTTNQRGHRIIYEAKSKILLQKFFSPLSNFLGRRNNFWLKSALEFGHFLQKTGNLNLISVNYLAGKNAKSLITQKRVIFIKNHINSFFINLLALQKLLIPFFTKMTPLETKGVHVRLSLDTQEWRPTVVVNKM